MYIDAVQDKAWVTDCDYMPEIRRLAICSETSIRLVDIRANGTNQVYNNCAVCFTTTAVVT